MNEKFTTQKIQQILNHPPAEVSSGEDWVAYAILKRTPKFANTIYSFFCLRQNNPFYPKTNILEYSNIEAEQSYLRLVYSLYSNDFEKVPVGIQDVVSQTSSSSGSRFKHFIYENLVEVCNVLISNEENPIILNELIKTCSILMMILLELKHSNCIKGFNFGKDFQDKLLKASSEVEEDFVTALMIIPFWKLIEDHQNIICRLMKTKKWSAVIKGKYLSECAQDLGLILNYKSFFLEVDCKYPLGGTKLETEQLLLVYAKLNNESAYESWTAEDFKKLSQAIQNYEISGHSNLKTVFNHIRLYYLKLSNIENKNDPVMIEIRNFLKLVFDAAILINFSPINSYFLKSLPNPDYFLYSWDVSPENELLLETIIDCKLTLKENLYKIFKIKSAKFQGSVFNSFYNSSFYFTNHILFTLNMVSDLFLNKDVRLNALSLLFKQLPSLGAGTSTFHNEFINEQERQYKLISAINFFKNEYSEARLLSLLRQSPNFWVFLSLLIDTYYGFETLKQYVTQHKPEHHELLKMPKKPKNLDNLHTAAYSRIALLSTEKIDLYPYNHPAWVIEGFQSLDKRMQFSVPKNSWDLKLFSLEMKNCVGGYLDKILRNESIILNIYLDNKPYINVEIKDSKINEIKQLNNGAVTPGEFLLVSETLKNAKLITN